MKRIYPIKPLELRPVIEVEPWHWSKREPPAVLRTNWNTADWDHYFAACMADAGIRGIAPIRPGSCFVDAFKVLENELILRMIREALAGCGVPGFPDAEGREEIQRPLDTGRLEGGYHIAAEDGEEFTPQCCCDFNSIRRWRRALIERPAHESLWIGHPLAEISFQDETVVVRHGWDSNDPPDWLPWFTVSVEELRQAVDVAEQKRREFARRLLPRVRELVPDPLLSAKYVVCLMGR